jgi:hypothetical protein
MPVICESCGSENPPGSRFCVNPECQAYLAWSVLDAGSEAQPETAPSSGSSGAVKPGSLHPGGSNHPHVAPGLTPVHTAGVSLTAAPTQPARLVEPPAQAAPKEPPLPPSARRPPRYELIRETQAPVAVKPIEEPLPDPPRGDAATNGKHGLWFALDQHALAVAPGREMSVGATVINKGTVVEGVDIRVLGVPESWVRIVPPRVNLDVGGRASLTIYLAPPKATSTRSGLAEVEVAVWSVSSPKVRCAEHLRLDVGTYHDLEIEPSPREQTVRRAADYQLDLHNNGNRPLAVEAQPRPGAPAYGKVHLKFEPRQATIPADGHTVVAVRARSSKRLLTGTPTTHTLQIEILGDGEPKPVELRMVQQPLLPRWAPKVLALVGTVAMLAIGLGGWNWYQHRPKHVPSVINQPVDLALANLSKAGFKGVALNAANPKVPQGLVFREVPPPGARRHPGSVIAITVSSGGKAPPHNPEGPRK